MNEASRGIELWHKQMDAMSRMHLTRIRYRGMVFYRLKENEVARVCPEPNHQGHSYAPNRDDLLRRLKRIEGQVRGIQKMIEEDRYCVDILIQIAAVKSAVHQVGLSILESHTRGCVADALTNQESGDKKIDELMEVIRQFTKS
jgi:DNA-binding FrmR family transcriptional regulator